MLSFFVLILFLVRRHASSGPATSRLHVMLTASRRYIDTTWPTRNPIFVLGNEAGDMDSCVSAVMFALLLSERHDRDCIPVLNIPRSEFTLRPDVVFAFDTAGLSADMLTFRDDIPLFSSASDAFSKLRMGNATGTAFSVILVDHNVLATFQDHLAPFVIGIIDHHNDIGRYPRALRTIASAGSCASIVSAMWTMHAVAEQRHRTDLLIGAPLQLEYLTTSRSCKSRELSTSAVETQSTSVSARQPRHDTEVATKCIFESLFEPQLLAGSILLDTNFFRYRHLVTQVDSSAILFLSREFCSLGGECSTVPRDSLWNNIDADAAKPFVNYFLRINALRFDVEDLSFNDILLRDEKTFTVAISPSTSARAPVRVAVATFTCDLRTVLRKVMAVGEPTSMVLRSAATRFGAHALIVFTNFFADQKGHGVNASAIESFGVNAAREVLLYVPRVFNVSSTGRNGSSARDDRRSVGRRPRATPREVFSALSDRIANDLALASTPLQLGRRFCSAGHRSEARSLNDFCAAWSVRADTNRKVLANVLMVSAGGGDGAHDTG